MSLHSKKPGSLRLGTYNVHRMMDGIPDPTTSNHRRPKPETRKSDTSMAAVASILRDSQVDIVSLQEVENLAMLTTLRDQNDLTEQFPYLELFEGNDPKGFDVAILSRYPFSRVETHREEVIGHNDEEALKFRRDLLEVDVELPNEETLRVFSNHYIAYRDRPYCNAIRQCEAEATMRIVRQQGREYPTDYAVIMGDFNDTDRSEALQVFQRNGMHNLSQGLPNSWGEVWPSKYPPTRLDHIVADDRLAENLQSRGVFVHPQDIHASDHRMVFVDVTLPQIRKAC
jgi:endonuclease/exonuclease/phosphatase family metal-dependent hydrolase